MVRIKYLRAFLLPLALNAGAQSAKADDRVADFSFQVSALKTQVGVICDGLIGVDEVRSESAAHVIEQSQELAREMSFFNASIQKFLQFKRQLVLQSELRVLELTQKLALTQNPTELRDAKINLTRAEGVKETLEQTDALADFKTMMHLSTEMKGVQKRAAWCYYIASGGKGIPADSKAGEKHQELAHQRMIAAAFPEAATNTSVQKPANSGESTETSGNPAK